jgi:hypothetical protein
MDWNDFDDDLNCPTGGAAAWGAAALLVAITLIVGILVVNWVMS